MKRKYKSEKEIKNDVFRILVVESENPKDFTNKIITYIKTFTERSGFGILSLQYIIYKSILEHCPGWLQNPHINKNLLFLKEIHDEFQYYSKTSIPDKDPEFCEFEATLILTRVSDNYNLLYNVKNKDTLLPKFKKFLLRNPEITHLLFQYELSKEKEIILNWVKCGQLPINSFRHFINQSNNIKEETERWYKTLNSPPQRSVLEKLRHFSRNEIQRIVSKAFKGKE